MERSTADRTGLCGNDEQKQQTAHKKKAEAQGLVRPDWKTAPEKHEPQLRKNLETERFWHPTDSPAEGGKKTAREREIERKEKREEEEEDRGGRRDEAGHSRIQR